MSRNFETTDYLKFHEEFCSAARSLAARKNHDYASPVDRTSDPFAVFANFMQAEHLNICTVEQGFLVRLSDKMSRLCNLLKPGHERAVADESAMDTAKDLINYVVLLMAYLHVKGVDRSRGVTLSTGPEVGGLPDLKELSRVPRPPPGWPQQKFKAAQPCGYVEGP